LAFIGIVTEIFVILFAVENRPLQNCGHSRVKTLRNG
jgi:hypothetical protein